MEELKPFDIIVDKYDYVYSIVTFSNNPEYIICDLKYVPYEVFPEKVLGFTWNIFGRPYTKVTTPRVENAFANSRFNIYNSKLDLTLYRIPVKYIKNTISHKSRNLEFINKKQFNNKVQLSTSRIFNYLVNELGIPLKNIGLSGSTLLSAELEQISDIDIVIDNIYSLNRIIYSLHRFDKSKNRNHLIKLKNEPEFWENYSDLSSIIKIPINEFANLTCKKVNKGWINDVPFSIFGYDRDHSPYYDFEQRNILGKVHLKGIILDRRSDYLFPSSSSILVTDVIENCTELESDKILGTIVNLESWCVWYIGFNYYSYTSEFEGIVIKNNNNFRILINTSSGFIK